MRGENRVEDDEPPVEGDSLMVKVHRLLVSAILSVIDTAALFLSRLRNRVETPSSDEDDSDRGKGRSRPHSGNAATPEVIAPQKPRRLVYVLVFVLALITGAISGAAYSYHLLSKTITSNSVIVERLREELADMKKQEALNLKELANRQQTISAYDKGIVRFLKEIEDYKAEGEDLRSQLIAAKSATKVARKGAASSDSRGSPATTTQQARPRKPETCVMDPANVAASLEKCVGEFNRK